MLLGYIVEVEVPVKENDATIAVQEKKNSELLIYMLWVYDMLDPDCPDENEIGLKPEVRAKFKEPGRNIGVLHARVAAWAESNHITIENFSFTRILHPTTAELVVELERAAFEMALCVQYERRVHKKVIEEKDAEVEWLNKHVGELHMIQDVAEGRFGCTHIALAKKEVFGKAVSH